MTIDYDALALEAWWNSVKNSPMWSGAIVGLSWSDLWPEAKEAVAEIARRYRDALAEKMEPVAWLFQHDETGRTMCVDNWQVNNGFEESNPRLQKIHPLYSLEDWKKGEPTPTAISMGAKCR